MRVLAWVPQALDTSPGQRFRIEQWEPFLRREGIEITYSPFSDQVLSATLKLRGAVLRKAIGVTAALARRLSEARRVGTFDLLYVFREGALIGPAVAEQRAARRGVPYVFDFDDAVWVRYLSPANSYFSYLRFPGKTATLCRRARHVMAGNPYLAEYARRLNPAVSVVPTTIDTARYQPRPPRRGGPLVVGWTGSYSSAQYLEVVREALERLRKRVDFRVVVVGGSGFRPAGVTVEERPWRSETEVEDLLDIDVGMMPLPDTDWERGKCGLKALQYMALGIATIVSPVGVNAEIVEPGRNGFHARSTEEWEDSLLRLLTEPDLRERLGQAGRRTVEEGYSADRHGPRVAAIFREAVEARRP